MKTLAKNMASHPTVQKKSDVAIAWIEISKVNDHDCPSIYSETIIEV